MLVKMCRVVFPGHFSSCCRYPVSPEVVLGNLLRVSLLTEKTKTRRWNFWRTRASRHWAPSCAWRRETLASSGGKPHLTSPNGKRTHTWTCTDVSQTDMSNTNEGTSTPIKFSKHLFTQVKIAWIILGQCDVHYWNTLLCSSQVYDTVGSLTLSLICTYYYI